MTSKDRQKVGQRYPNYTGLKNKLPLILHKFLMRDPFETHFASFERFPPIMSISAAQFFSIIGDTVSYILSNSVDNNASG